MCLSSSLMSFYSCPVGLCMRVSAPLCHFDEGLRVEEGNVVKQTIPQKQKEREHQVFVKGEKERER